MGHDRDGKQVPARAGAEVADPKADSEVDHATSGETNNEATKTQEPQQQDSSQHHLPDAQAAHSSGVPNPANTFAGPQFGIRDGEAESDGEDFVDEDEALSNYGGSATGSYCSTLRSDAEDYYWENGRRYHAQGGGRYLLPNDDTELDREDMKHHMWTLVLKGELHLAPIGENPQKILDVGTGSGIWAMQAADRYPSAEVIGFDISPVQPKWVPPNLIFEVDDLEQEWLWQTSAFDLVHCRFMFMSVSDWPAMLAQAYRTLKPGGYIELSELDLNPLPATEGRPLPPAISEWFGIQGSILARKGFDMRIASKFKGMLQDAGFEDVVETVRPVPWGTWPSDKRLKAIGYWHVEQLKMGLQGITMAALTRAGWSVPEVEIFLAGLRREMKDPSWQIQDQACIVYGRKPL